jgi:hypothetical protein
MLLSGRDKATHLPVSPGCDGADRGPRYFVNLPPWAGQWPARYSLGMDKPAYINGFPSAFSKKRCTIVRGDPRKCFAR